MNFVDVEEEGRGGDAPRHKELVLGPESQDVPEEGVDCLLYTSPSPRD